MSERPTGPEDEKPGPEITLTRDQFDALARFVPRKHLSVRLRDRGSGYAEAQLLDADGNVTRAQLLYLRYPQKMHGQTYLRWLRRRDEEEEASREGSP